MTHIVAAAPIQSAVERGSAFGLATDWRRLAAQTFLLAASYYLAARLGLGYRFQNTQIGVVWPASSVLLCGLLLMPRSRWWLVLLATVVAHVAAVGNTVPVWRALWQILGNSVLGLSVVIALRRFAGLPVHLGSRRQ